MEYYCSPTAMTALPTHPLLSDLPNKSATARSAGLNC